MKLIKNDKYRLVGSSDKDSTISFYKRYNNSTKNITIEEASKTSYSQTPIVIKEIICGRYNLSYKAIKVAQGNGGMRNDYTTGVDAFNMVIDNYKLSLPIVNVSDLFSCYREDYVLFNASFLFTRGRIIYEIYYDSDYILVVNNHNKCFYSININSNIILFYGHLEEIPGGDNTIDARLLSNTGLRIKDVYFDSNHIVYDYDEFSFIFAYRVNSEYNKISSTDGKYPVPFNIDGTIINIAHSYNDLYEHYINNKDSITIEVEERKEMIIIKLVIFILYILAGLVIMLMQRRINKNINIANPVGLVIVLLAWPLYIRTTVPAYRKSIILEITREVIKAMPPILPTAPLKHADNVVDEKR